MKGLRFSLTTMGTTLSLLALGATNPAESITLTSITLDPENATGQTTNAPGAYSTNTADPLAQIGVMSSNGVFLNNPGANFDLGEISIDLQPGINTFRLFGDFTSPGNTHYGAILFFEGVSTPPQIAVFNANGGTGNFSIQAAGTQVMGGANGGLFFDIAPGTSLYTAPDGSSVEVIGFTIDSITPGTDMVSFLKIGANGINDTTATLSLKFTPANAVPEPTSTLSLLALGTLGAASTLKRKLKPSQSTEKETTKVG
jgi:hypothetical protein